MKKLLSLVLAVCVLAAPMAASSADTEDTTDVVHAAETLQIGDYILLGRYYDQPILWRCIDIDENGPLMLSDKILCRKLFSLKNENRWSTSIVRTWLNSADETEFGFPKTATYVSDYYYEKGFLSDTNFTHSERNIMKTVTQKTLLAPGYAAYAVGGDANKWGKNDWEINFNEEYFEEHFMEERYDEICYEYTTDKVFLPDIKQIWDMYQKKELLGENYHIGYFTPEAMNDNNNFPRWPGVEYDNSWATYWLRTPFGWTEPSSPVGPARARDWNRVMYLNHFEDTFWVVKEEAKEKNGIRPAFYLDEATAQILSGSGTEEDPYVVDGKQIAVYVNGTELTLDVPPMLENDRTLVPMRAIFEVLGAEVSWYPEDRTIVAVRGDTTVFMQVDDWYMSVNDEWIRLDAPPRIVNDRTLIPLRAVAEALGAQVGWDEATQTVTVELY